MEFGRISAKLKNYGGLVMFSHTVFSLPFGIIAAIWAADGIPPVRVAVWVLVALIAARNGANAFNRVADARIDAKNARTATRHIPTGKVTIKEAAALTVFCFALTALAAALLNWTCLILLPIPIALFIFYSYSKRVTWLCHFILGVCCGGAPVGAWIAVTGTVNFTAIVMGGVVCAWVAGFDIIYATQDIEFDRRERLHSVPAKFGLQGALIISALSHIGAVFGLLLLWYLLNLGIIYLLGVAAIFAVLVLEHYSVSPLNKKKMEFASYIANQIVSMLFLVFAGADFVIGRYL
ncbi:4-hydroxybenzoate octaprenyltransferase [Clostridia bacterium]|nr:4-hydroxybenzoate octaprenyltransferase [Clostridia bacterium]